jgi:acetoin utilization protein AcuB
MNVVEIMTEKPVTIGLDKSLSDALETMQSVGCHHLPVVGNNDHLVGIISDRDCRIALNTPSAVRESWRDNALANKLLVRGVMTPAPIIVEPNTPAAEAARLMLVNHIGCLPVMRSETLVGIITKSDILMAFMNIYNRIQHYSDGQNMPRES